LGQQQLLLIVLGVIVVGIAIIMGILLFRQYAIEEKRDAVINEGITVAHNAIQYYNKPKVLGGGGFSFLGWKIPSNLKTSPNGSYLETVNADDVEITGTGNELVSGTDSVKIKFTVTRTGVQTTIIN
jgi:uncharacterized membrane protein YqiK